MGPLRPRSAPQSGGWRTVGVWSLLAAGVVASAVAALCWRAVVLSENRRDLDAAVHDLSTTTEFAVRRYTDVLASMRSTLALSPTLDNRDFARWVSAADVPERQPGTLGYAYVERVPASRLNAVTEDLTADPPPTAQPLPGVAVVPLGQRPFYCLLRLGVNLVPGTQGILPAGLDLCAARTVPGLGRGSPFPLLQSACDTGEFTIREVSLGQGLYAMVAPVYRSGATPATAAEREHQLAGWVGATFNGGSLLTGQPFGGGRVRVELRHTNPGEAPQLVAARGEAPHGAPSRELTVNVEGTWQIKVITDVGRGILSPTQQALLVLAGGLVLTGLLFGFVFMLARSHRRAVRMVERRTEQLRHLALHDPLTGLPNRALILDRIEQALEISARTAGPLAVLFLDLDGFKAINDTLGHAAGDRLLRAVALRLRGLLPAEDTVGRLGGDEFVIVARGPSLGDGVEQLAERVRLVINAPLAIGPGPGATPGVGHASIRPGVSIGVATGARSSAEDLLHDADQALYRAKKAGKGRYAIFAGPQPPAQALLPSRHPDGTVPVR